MHCRSNSVTLHYLNVARLNEAQQGSLPISPCPTVRKIEPDASGQFQLGAGELERVCARGELVRERASQALVMRTEFVFI